MSLIPTTILSPMSSSCKFSYSQLAASWYKSDTHRHACLAFAYWTWLFQIWDCSSWQSSSQTWLWLYCTSWRLPLTAQKILVNLLPCQPYSIPTYSLESLPTCYLDRTLAWISRSAWSTAAILLAFQNWTSRQPGFAIPPLTLCSGIGSHWHAATLGKLRM